MFLPRVRGRGRIPRSIHNATTGAPRYAVVALNEKETPSATPQSLFVLLFSWIRPVIGVGFLTRSVLQPWARHTLRLARWQWAVRNSSRRVSKNLKTQKVMLIEVHDYYLSLSLALRKTASPLAHRWYCSLSPYAGARQEVDLQQSLQCRANRRIVEQFT
jgi:hypothetical protein